MNAVPRRELELAGFLSRYHHRVRHHLSASECESMTVSALLAMADAGDRARWEGLTLAYTDPAGAPWLRQTIAGHYATLGPDDLVCCAGAQEGLYAVLHAVMAPGEHAVVVVPGYQSMETLPLGIGSATGVALNPAEGWSLDIDAVAAACRAETRVVSISFPNNPTGALLPRDRLDALVALCRSRGLWLLSDEVYRLSERDPSARMPAAADVYERGISVGVLSKTYGLPGLRVGWIACRDAGLIRRVTQFRQYLSVCSAGPSEVLADIAIKNTAVVVGRTMALADGNLALLRGFLARHDGLFDWVEPAAGVVGFVRYLGAEGAERFVAAMAEAGILLLPPSVFRSDLVVLAEDRFRIGFGGAGFSVGLGAMETALLHHPG